MKYALILLLIVSAVITWRFSKSTAHFTVKSISDIKDTTNLTVSVDREVIFSGRVDDQTSKFNMLLWKGRHAVEVKANNDVKLEYRKEFDLKGNAWIYVIYQAKYIIDPATNGYTLKRTLNLKVKD
jgi:hypothetical protein